MAVKMAGSIPVLRVTIRLADIVKQYGEPHDLIATRRFQRCQGVLPHIVNVIPVVLLKPNHGNQLRQNGQKELLSLPYQPGQSMPTARKNLPQFAAHVVRRHCHQRFPMLDCRPQQPRIRLKSQQSRCAHGSENGLSVSRKIPVRIAHTANCSVLQIRAAQKGIH